MFSNHQILGYPTFGQTNSLDNFDGQKCWFVTKWRWIKSLGQCQRLQIGYPILSHSHVILALLSLAHFVFWTGNTDEEVCVQRALRVFDMFEIGSNTWTKGMHRLAGLFACFCVFFWVCVCVVMFLSICQHILQGIIVMSRVSRVNRGPGLRL